MTGEKIIPWQSNRIPPPPPKKFSFCFIFLSPYFHWGAHSLFRDPEHQTLCSLWFSLLLVYMLVRSLVNLFWLCAHIYAFFLLNPTVFFQTLFILDRNTAITTWFRSSHLSIQSLFATGTGIGSVKRTLFFPCYLFYYLALPPLCSF